MCVPEASKLVMSYVAAVCGKGQEVNKVKEQLLQSNPVLEGEWAPFTLKLCPTSEADFVWSSRSEIESVLRGRQRRLKRSQDRQPTSGRHEWYMFAAHSYWSMVH